MDRIFGSALLFILIVGVVAQNQNKTKSDWVAELTTSTNDLNLIVNDNKVEVAFRLNRTFPEDVIIKLACVDYYANRWDDQDNGCKLINQLAANYTIAANKTELRVNITGKEAGKEVLNGYINISRNVDVSRAFIRINIGHNQLVNVISSVVGWCYFAAWSVSFYPQIWINFKRKSVIGLNFDYVGLNITGFLFYTIYNWFFYFSSDIHDIFQRKNRFSQIPVELNDVFFGIHAVAATLTIIIQCFVYERGDQKPSLFAKLFLAVVWVGAVALAIIVPTTNWLDWLDYLYYFSYVKLTITIIKYIPQAWFNYQRKSTVGWSIGNILLDFTGGVLSLIQMFMLGYNYNDWKNIFTNFTKFGLGFVSILFDVLFIVQHYVLYRHSDEIDLSTSTATLTHGDHRTEDGPSEYTSSQQYVY